MKPITYETIQLIPIRCFTCGKMMGDKTEPYKEYIKAGFSKKEALDKLNLRRYCCRRMVLTVPNDY